MKYIAKDNKDFFILDTAKYKEQYKRGRKEQMKDAKITLSGIVDEEPKEVELPLLSCGYTSFYPSGDVFFTFYDDISYNIKKQLGLVFPERKFKVSKQ